MKRGTIVILLATALGLAAQPTWALDFKPGKYQITSETEMPGMPMKIPPQTFVQCVTKEDPVPVVQQGQNGCAMKSQQVKGNRVSWEMECNQQGQVTTGTGEVTYSGTSFNGVFKVTIAAPTGNMTMTTKTRGERIGACD
jgi:hypothetical protein